MHMLQGLPSFCCVLMICEKAICVTYIMHFSLKYILKYKFLYLVFQHGGNSLILQF